MMFKRNIFYAIAIMIGCLPASGSAVADTLLTGLDRTITWNHPEEFFAASALNLEFDAVIKPDRLIVKRASQAGMDYLVMFEALNIASYLPTDFENDCIDESSEIAESCFVQAGTHDFDADGLPEIILAVGDGLVNLQVNVFSYHPPARPADAMRTENWELVGNFSGQSKVEIKGQAVIIPFGSQGFEQKMVFIDRSFVEIDQWISVDTPD